MLGIILIIIVFVFGSMLTTSYAWYSYEKGSTKFDVVTANDNVEIIYQTGEFINTDVAIPIKEGEIDRYSDKYDFNIKVKKKIVGNELVAKISLVDIMIDDVLKKVDEEIGDSPLRVQFFYQGHQVGNTITGKDFNDVVYEIGDVVLSDEIDNQFELRVYLLDNGKDQSELMNKTFQAKIEVNVISRLSTSFVSFDESDIMISDITIDGKKSSSLPVSGYYEMAAICEKGSNIDWDVVNKSLVYHQSSYIHDSCKLSFTKSSNQFYLKDVLVGSYVQYVGNNGCDGNLCSGDNANFIDEFNQGYCGSSDYHFTSHGWRVAYLKDDTAFLVNAGSLECVCPDSDGEASTNCSSQELVDVDKFFASLNRVASKYCNSTYAYHGICNEESVWSVRADDIQLMMNGNSYQNSLLDNGSYYWYQDLSSLELHYWNPQKRMFDKGEFASYGLRAIVRLDSGVMVVGGSGTYDDPYIIRK